MTRSLFVVVSLLMSACGGEPPRLARAPRRIGSSNASGAIEVPAPEPPNLAHARSEAGAATEERLVELDEREELHLVLGAERCHRIRWVFLEPVAASLRDAEGNTIREAGAGESGFDSVCPRWTGSFVLELRGPRARGYVLLN